MALTERCCRASVLFARVEDVITVVRPAELHLTDCRGEANVIAMEGSEDWKCEVG